jgi:hypothetical protein
VPYHHATLSDRCAPVLQPFVELFALFCPQHKLPPLFLFCSCGDVQISQQPQPHREFHMELSGLNSCREAYLQLNIVAAPRELSQLPATCGKTSAGEIRYRTNLNFPYQRGLSVNRAVLERVPPYFESRADAVGPTAPIFSATTLAAS